MEIKDSEISKLEDLNTLRTAPKLNKIQSEILLNQAKNIIYKADWLTIGIMSPSLNNAISIVRRIEKVFKYNELKCISLPKEYGPIFLKANQKTGEINARIEYGLGEGILISCHSYESSIDSKTIGPFPLDIFN